MSGIAPSGATPTKVALLLASSVVLFTTTLAMLVFVLWNDWLLTLSILAVALYSLSFIGYRIYQAWLEPLKQLRVFVQAQQQGQSNLSLNIENSNSPYAQLANELSGGFKQRNTVTEAALFSLLEAWPAPILVFDNKSHLRFFNFSMQQQLSTPLILDMPIDQAGFLLQQQTIRHPLFDQQWQISLFKLSELDYTLVCAFFIGDQLQQTKRQSQADLIRILTHELSNALTPMSSMADTLLACDTLPEAQTRQALARIKNRSTALLEFIQTYATMSRLPEPTASHFDLKTMLLACAQEQNVSVQFEGSTTLYADALQMELVLINLLKNAKEASSTPVQINVQLQLEGRWQQLVMVDNGPGFANLNNALTPLYTTKTNGHGLGLAICQDIVERHKGTITLSNLQSGAKIAIRLPL